MLVSLWKVFKHEQQFRSAPLAPTTSDAPPATAEASGIQFYLEWWSSCPRCGMQAKIASRRGLLEAIQSLMLSVLFMGPPEIKGDGSGRYWDEYFLIHSNPQKFSSPLSGYGRQVVVVRNIPSLQIGFSVPLTYSLIYSPALRIWDFFFISLIQGNILI